MLKATLRIDLQLRELQKRVQRKRRKVLYRAAGFARTVMRNRIKTAKKQTSREGQAPKSKTRRLKAGVRFDVDATRGEALVGFVKFRSDQATPLGGKTVPQVINEGGRERLRQDGRTIARPDGTVRTIAPQTLTAEYGPRPTVEPVLEPARNNLRELMRDVPL